MVNTVKNFKSMLNNLQQMHLKLSKRVIQKPAGATGDSIGKKSAYKITRTASECAPEIT